MSMILTQEMLAVQARIQNVLSVVVQLNSDVFVYLTKRKTIQLPLQAGHHRPPQQNAI